MHNAFGMHRENIIVCHGWELHCQWPVLSYIADFVLITPDLKMVIECDGHDFHERTKQQAAHDRKRDRAMTQEGWMVLRFTGSEIWANPFACVTQCAEIAIVADYEASKKRLTA